MQLDYTHTVRLCPGGSVVAELTVHYDVDECRGDVYLPEVVYLPRKVVLDRITVYREDGSEWSSIDCRRWSRTCPALIRRWVRGLRITPDDLMEAADRHVALGIN